MSARRRTDAEGVAAVVTLFDKIDAGERSSLGEVLTLVYGWDPERAFRAVDQALRMGWIAKNADGAVRSGELSPLVQP